MASNRFFNQGINNSSNEGQAKTTEPVKNISVTPTDSTKVTPEVPSKIELPENASLEDKLLSAYIGKNAYKILTTKVSVPPFLFGALYCFYRRLFGLGLIVTILNLTLYYYGFYVYSLLINIALIFAFNPIYIWRVRGKVRNIINQNQGKTFEELEAICKADGGPSGLAVVLGLIINYGVSILVIWILILNGISHPVADLVKNLIHYNGTPYVGVLDYAEPDVIIFNYPESFTRRDLYSAYIELAKDENDKSEIRCTMELNKVLGFNDAQDLAKKMAEYHETTLNDAVTVNNHTWYNLSYITPFGTTYVYLTTIKNNVYSYEYKIQNKADLSLCKTYINTGLQLIEYK